MKTYEKPYLYLAFGAVFPITFFLTGWWSTYGMQLPEKQIMGFAFAGLTLGIIIDFLFLGKLVKHAFDLPDWIILLLYLFYSVLVYGLFMGIPIFNIGVTVASGYYLSRRLARKNITADKLNSVSKSFAIFSSSIIFILCIVTVLFAMKDKQIGSSLAMIMGRNETFSEERSLVIMIAGSFILLSANYWLARRSVIRFFQLSIMK